MSDLRIGAFQLAPKDTAYVRALVRLFAHTEKLSWSFADAAPYHAVVVNPTSRAAHPDFFAPFKGLVLTLVAGPGTPAQDMVAYPIRANQFRDWLRMRQDTLLGVLYLAQTPTVQPVSTMTSALASAVPAEAGRRFKLRRWPPAQLLGGDAAALRMATAMSRNALDIGQLVALTSQPASICRAFVGVLHDAGLLVELVALTTPAGAAGTGIAPAGGATLGIAAAAPARLGLMASLRRHLGL